MDGAERPQWQRPSAEQMDEQRRQNVAYQYLCRLEEAKRWMETCLGEELPPPTELEENLRNGVLLARLGHRFAPDAVPPARIYDPQQTRYRVSGLQFRHTDNINHWRCALSRLGLPSIFHPETTDIYDKKNMPRAVYCLHALSLYLFKLGLAPQIQDLSGKVDFTEEEISDAGRELEKLGLQLPAFSRIGGILADELSLDEAAVHAAVLAINMAVQRGDAAQTMEALLHPGAMLRGLRTALAAAYQDVLRGAQREKGGRREWVPEEGEDIYTCCLTQEEIQGSISRANVHAALEEVDDAVQRGDALLLHRALQDPALSLPHLQRDDLQLCLEQLRVQRQQKALELGYVELLDEEEVAVGIQVANERGEEERATLRAVSAINAAIRRGIPAATLQALLEPSAQLPAALPHAAALYQQQLALLQRQHPRGELLHEELFVAVEMLSAVALVNRALDAGNPEELWAALLSSALGLSGVEEENARRYFDSLLQLKDRRRKAGAEFLSWTDIQDGVNATNSSVRDENDRLLAVRRINAALRLADPQRTLAALLLPAAALPDVLPPNAPRYHRVLSRARAAKAQATEDGGAELWWEEIERGVRAANEETAAARRMALGTAAINQAIREGRAAQTLRVLRNPDVGLRGVRDACAAGYQEQLQALAATKRPTGSTKPRWVRHRLRDGSEFYLSLQSFEGSWERPGDGELCATHLSREEIQSVITQVSAAHDRQLLWASNEAAVLRLQALLRGFLARRRFTALRRQQKAAVRIQACWRGYRQRKAFLQRLRFLRAHVDAVIKIQAAVRMWRARKRYQERLRHFRKNVSDGWG